MSIRLGLFREVVVMAFDTVRTNKMRSGLTVLGIVIGITAIVGMTALIRGFDQSVRDCCPSALTPALRHHRLRQRRRDSRSPEAAESDVLRTPRALETAATTLQYVDLELGGSIGPTVRERIFYRTLKTSVMQIIGTSEYFADTAHSIPRRRFFNGTEPAHEEGRRPRLRRLSAAVRQLRHGPDR